MNNLIPIAGVIDEAESEENQSFTDGMHEVIDDIGLMDGSITGYAILVTFDNGTVESVWAEDEERMIVLLEEVKQKIVVGRIIDQAEEDDE